MISNIQRFCIHDGTGIRTTVFFKGCPLRCAWCSNPETQNMSAELMIKDKGCAHCGACISACPFGALQMNAGKVEVDRANCLLCGNCLGACPNALIKIEGRDLTADEVMRIVSRDKPFYDVSGGGLTLSGGEPLMQPILAKELLILAKETGISTCIETCLFAPFPVMQDLLDFLDEIYFDFKHSDPEKHRQFTGMDNELIAANIQKLINVRPDAKARIPVISGFNDSREDIAMICQSLHKYGIHKVELMHYHNLASSKYTALGRDYFYKNVPLIDENRFSEIIRTYASFSIDILDPS